MIMRRHHNKPRLPCRSVALVARRSNALAAGRSSALIVFAVGAIVFAGAAALSPDRAFADDSVEKNCAIDGVRTHLADDGDVATIELSARVRPIHHQSTICEVDWSLVSLHGADPSEAAPVVTFVQSFFDHALQRPLILAEGIASASIRAFRGEVPADGAVVAVRIIVEGASAGLRVEIPRTTFPAHTSPGARIEQRVKSSRAGVARFGELGEMPIIATEAGPAGGVGPSRALGNERASLSFQPSFERSEVIQGIEGVGAAEAPRAMRSGAAIALDAFRDTLPRRVFDLSTANEKGWDEIAREAFAGALHSDPVVASMGTYTLSWLAAGLALQTTRIAVVSSGTDVAVAPSKVIDAIGDAQGRLQKRYGAVGRLLPLGRPSIFRKALAAQPWRDPARAKAAKDAIARLKDVAPETLVSNMVPAIINPIAPVDPPATSPPAGLEDHARLDFGGDEGTHSPLIKSVTPSSRDEQSVTQGSTRRKSRGRPAKHWLVVGGASLLFVIVGYALRRSS
ncbi:MAG: hypothetical protein NVS3B20_05410 [Polyangiales bacterium]